MFGKDRFKEAIKTHVNLPAKELVNVVIAALDEFSHPPQKEDDVTLVIVKVEEL
jgi:serine phosphatase RsbU (regulator of sigma subunit)